MDKQTLMGAKALAIIALLSYGIGFTIAGIVSIYAGDYVHLLTAALGIGAQILGIGLLCSLAQPPRREARRTYGKEALRSTA